MKKSELLDYSAALAFRIFFEIRNFKPEISGPAFIVNLPGRKSSSPEAAFYTGPRTGGRFLEGAPVFAVEVRSKEDYGPKAEQALAAKRADYLRPGRS